MNHCGIDISKPFFDVAVFDGDDYQCEQFGNDPEGIKAFLKWSSGLKQPMMFCMEATGIYYLPLAKALHQSGAFVIVVNPIKTHGFAKLEMQRNKTDVADAQMIARFAAYLHSQKQHQDHKFKPKDKAYEALQSLVTRREQLQLLRTEENNRLHVATCHVTRRSIQTTIRCFDKQIGIIEKQMKQCQAQNKRLDQQVKLLMSINGVGFITACSILAYLGDISDFANAGKVASYAGLTPRKIESGTSIKRSKLSKQGHKKLRKALYFPAIVATQHNPVLKTKYQSLLAVGKPPKMAICAIMRKLLVISYGVLKSQMPFSPELYGKNMQ